MTLISGELARLPDREETFSDSKHQRVREVRRGAVLAARLR